MAKRNQIQKENPPEKETENGVLIFNDTIETEEIDGEGNTIGYTKVQKKGWRKK